MTTASTRKPAVRPARPVARYWKGRAPKGVAEVASDSDQDGADVAREEEEDVLIEEEEFLEIEQDEDTPSVPTKGLNLVLNDVNLADKVIIDGMQQSEAANDEGEL